MQCEKRSELISHSASVEQTGLVSHARGVSARKTQSRAFDPCGLSVKIVQNAGVFIVSGSIKAKAQEHISFALL